MVIKGTVCEVQQEQKLPILENRQNCSKRYSRGSKINCLFNANLMHPRCTIEVANYYVFLRHCTDMKSFDLG